MIARINSLMQQLSKMLFIKLPKRLFTFIEFLVLLIPITLSCNLVTYRNTNVVPYSGLRSIQIEPTFTDSMNLVNSYAQDCNVTVMVIQAFRKERQPLHNTVVPPSKISNHLIGHAIDMNVVTPTGWCNSRCLKSMRDSDANCFIKRVYSNPALRWGGIFKPSDPVHIDDATNRRDYRKWLYLYHQLQPNCL